MLALLLGGLGLLQEPARPAPATQDTVRLETIDVSVTRSEQPARRVPATVQVLDSADLRRGRLLVGIDEALGQLPGIVVTNRFNPSLDQRLVIRGAGSRASIGVRGIKLLIDGLPQTLPDGQSQLSNLDLGLVSRVETLSGSASALYGNASGGVVSFTTEIPQGTVARARLAGGSFGTSRASVVLGASRGRLSGLVAANRYRSDGFRDHSRTESRQLTLSGNAVLGSNWLLRTRYFLTSSPQAENPGALTAAELAVRPDTASRNNILRGADKAVTQQQLGLTLSHASTGGGRVELALFGLSRDLTNPLGTSPPGPPSPTTGTYNAIDRLAGGGRLLLEAPLGGRGRIGGGLELQSMRDIRVNRRSDAGLPTDTILVDQRETATEIGPFLTLRLEPSERIELTGAIRVDRLRFATSDRLLSDGSDDSGERSMAALSGSLGASLTLPIGIAWAAVSSAFETPTTTELANRPDGGAGFNQGLDPQRATSVETGLRGGGAVRWSVVAYRTVVRRAIIQARETDGRAYFENAGRLRHQGVEAAVDGPLAGWLRGHASYGLTASRFLDYRVRDGTAVDTLDGKRVPGIPRHTARLALIGSFGRTQLELEQQLSSSQTADDDNAIVVDGWGAGVTNLRAVTRLVTRAGLSLAPFLSIQNLFDRRYVGSVTVNGFGGRVFEPAAGRWLVVGMEVAAAGR
ncbi:MAG: TonB-dependent receptor family protein [Gemmatimonadales bacterium]